MLDYFLFRPQIRLFEWIAIHHTPLPLQSIRLQRFFSNYLPDVCWCLALCLTTVTLYQARYLHLRTALFTLVLPFLLETGQYLKLVPGTFDWLDILIYTIIVTPTATLLIKTIAYEKDE